MGIEPRLPTPQAGEYHNTISDSITVIGKVKLHEDDGLGLKKINNTARETYYILTASLSLSGYRSHPAHTEGDRAYRYDISDSITTSGGESKAS